MDHNSSDYATCESIARSCPWFEHWHKMMTNHAQTGPVAEHGIAYLKNHFQYEVAEYLKASETLSEAEVLETTSGMEAYQQATEDARIQRRENQQQYKQEQAAAMEGMSQN
ncbi:hypothetical protein NDA12_002788 [Ustilago hordei]|nr:hypothetical protein NDA12_002788 [Ustilago hordei]